MPPKGTIQVTNGPKAWLGARRRGGSGCPHRLEHSKCVLAISKCDRCISIWHCCARASQREPRFGLRGDGCRDAAQASLALFDVGNDPDPNRAFCIKLAVLDCIGRRPPRLQSAANTAASGGGRRTRARRPTTGSLRSRPGARGREPRRGRCRELVSQQRTH